MINILKKLFKDEPLTLSPLVICNGLGRKHNNEHAINLWYAQYEVAMREEALLRAMEISRRVK